MGEKLNVALAVFLSFFIGGILIASIILGGLITLPFWLLIGAFLGLGAFVFGAIQFVYIVYAFINDATKEKKNDPPRSYKLGESKEAH